MKRRDFLRTTAIGLKSSAIALAGKKIQSASASKEERFPIVDTHMHVWSSDPSRFPFAHPYDPDFKPPPFAATVDVLLEEMDQFGIDHAVLVQVIYYGWDNRYVAECIKRHPRRFRAQGLIDPTAPDKAEKLKFWMREHGLSGMRFSPIYYRGKDEWLNSEESYALWKSAEELGAIFNFFIATEQLPKLEKMISRFAGVKVVIDHLARVDLKAPNPESEFEKLLRLSKYPNVWAKVSELQIISATREFPYRDTFPYVERLYDAFGADRLLWGTGFPGPARQQAGRLPLEKELELINREIPSFTAEDRNKILGMNAVALWNFTAPQPPAG